MFLYLLTTNYSEDALYLEEQSHKNTLKEYCVVKAVWYLRLLCLGRVWIFVYLSTNINHFGAGVALFSQDIFLFCYDVIQLQLLLMAEKTLQYKTNWKWGMHKIILLNR